MKQKQKKRMCLLFLSLPFAVLLNGGPVALEMQSDDENDNDSKGIPGRTGQEIRNAFPKAQPNWDLGKGWYP